MSVPAPEVDLWTPIGPTRIESGGGKATGVLFHVAIPASNPDVIYVSSPTSGVWASADHAASWRDASANLPTLAVFALAVDPGNPDRVYAAIGGVGVYVSADGGGSWALAGPAPAALPSITDLLVSPGDGRLLYLRTQSGIYRSNDGGGSWQLSLSGATSNFVMAPGDPNILYAGVPTVGVLRSRDGGTSWAALTPPGQASAAFDIRIAVTAADRATIYARYRVPTTGNEIWGSNDGGGTWSLRSTPSDYLSVIAADDTDAGRVYVGGVDFFRSDDGGGSWTFKGGAHVDHHAVATDLGHPTDIYTACDGGLYRSTQADNWGFVADGIANVEFYDLAVSPTRPELAIGGTQDNGTPITDGSAIQWGKVSGGDGGTVSIDPQNAQVMYVMQQYATSIARSDDGGASFTNIGDGLPTGSACFNLRFGVHPQDSGLVLACCGALWQTPVPETAWSAIFTPPGAPSETAQRFAVARDNTYYVGTNTGRIYVGPGGGGWQLGFAHPFGAAVTDLVVDPDDAATVLYAAFAGADPRVYRLDRNAPPVVVGARARPEPELSIGLLRGLGGAPGLLTPQALTSGLPPGLAVQTLAVDAMRPFTLYAGTNLGVFRARSTDGGTTWTWSDYNLGLPPADVRALRVQSSTGLMRAATFGRSAYQVLTDAPVGSLLNASGRITFLRVHDVGTGWGRPPNELDAEVILLLDSQPGLSFGFQLRADAEAPTRRDMLALLESAFVNDRPVSVDYIRTAPRVGTVIRVARID